jgi:hypothetical protein
MTAGGVAYGEPAAEVPEAAGAAAEDATWLAAAEEAP